MDLGPVLKTLELLALGHLIRQGRQWRPRGAMGLPAVHTMAGQPFAAALDGGHEPNLLAEAWRKAVV